MNNPYKPVDFTVYKSNSLYKVGLVFIRDNRPDVYTGLGRTTNHLSYYFDAMNDEYLEFGNGEEEGFPCPMSEAFINDNSVKGCYHNILDKLLLFERILKTGAWDSFYTMSPNMSIVGGSFEADILVVDNAQYLRDLTKKLNDFIPYVNSDFKGYERKIKIDKVLNGK